MAVFWSVSSHINLFFSNEMRENTEVYFAFIGSERTLKVSDSNLWKLPQVLDMFSDVFNSWSALFRDFSSGGNFPSLTPSLFWSHSQLLLLRYASHTHSVPLLCLARHLSPSSGLEGLFEHRADVNVIVKCSRGKRINEGQKISVSTS